MKFLLPIGVFLVSGSLVSCGSLEAHAAGRIHARQDLAGGLLVQEVYGVPVSWSGRFEKALWERYQIQTRRVGGTIVDNEIVRHAEGYNDVMIPAIQARYGADVFERTAAEIVSQR